MPPAQPAGEAAPADGALPARSLQRGADRPSVSTCTCRSARSAAGTATSTPIRPPTRDCAGCLSGDVCRRRRSPRSGWRGGCSGTPTCRSRRCFRWRYADAAAAGGPGEHRRGDRQEFGLCAGRGGDDRVQPRQRRADDLVELRAGGFNRISSACSPRAARTGHARPDARSRPGAGGGRVGARGRLRAAESRPDLRHAGGVAGRLAGQRRVGAGAAPGPRRRTR